jgi:hypothetical protein
MSIGYPNATFFYNSNRDHAYTALPFVISNDNAEGFIIVDPTSDQLFNKAKASMRNYIFTTSGKKWEYITDWARGSDLYADIDDSKFSNLSTLKNHPQKDLYESSKMSVYYDSVFKNPVDISDFLNENKNFTFVQKPGYTISIPKIKNSINEINSSPKNNKKIYELIYSFLKKKSDVN